MINLQGSQYHMQSLLFLFVVDCRNIIPYVQKFKKNPVTGLPLALKDLIKLHFHKNADGEIHYSFC